MRLVLFNLVLLSLLAVYTPVESAADDAKPGTQTAHSFTVKSDDGKEATVRYWLFLPESYDDQEAWPLMLFMHGAGERGDDLELVKKWGPPKLVESKKDFPFVVISPQCPKSVWWNVDHMVALVDRVAGERKIDKSRMCTTGLSMGGFGTWAIIAKHPKLFAAAVPICGGGDPKEAEKLTHLPIWAFHGDKDNVVPPSRSQAMVDAVNQAGGKAKLTIYEGVGHNSWSETYANEEVYQWLLSHKRGE